MLFKKILSITLAAAMSASMISAAPNTRTASVAVAADDTQEEELVECRTCHNLVPKSEIRITASGWSGCYDCYPLISTCFPCETAKIYDTLTDFSNDYLVFENKGKYILGACELQHLINKLGHRPEIGEKLYIVYYYDDYPDADTHCIRAFKEASNNGDEHISTEYCQMCGREFETYDPTPVPGTVGFYYCDECADTDFPKEGKEITIEDEIIFRRGSFIEFKNAGVFKLPKSVLEKSNIAWDTFCLGIKLKTTFTYDKKNIRVITDIKSAEKTGTTELMRLSNRSFYEAEDVKIQYADDDIVLFFGDGPYYLDEDYSHNGKYDLSLLDKNEHYTIKYEYDRNFNEEIFFIVDIESIKKSDGTEVTTSYVTKTPKTRTIGGVFDHIADGKLYFINGEGYPFSEEDMPAADYKVLKGFQKGNIIGLTLTSEGNTEKITGAELSSAGTTTTSEQPIITTTTTTTVETSLPITSIKEYALTNVTGVFDNYKENGRLVEIYFTNGSKYTVDNPVEGGGLSKEDIIKKLKSLNKGDNIAIKANQSFMAASWFYDVFSITVTPVSTTTVTTTTVTSPVTSVKEYGRTSFTGIFERYADCGNYKELYLSNGTKYTLSSLYLEGGLSQKEVADILKSLKKGDNITVTANQSAMAVNYLYDIFSITVTPAATTTTTATTTYPYNGGTNNDVPDWSTRMTEPEQWMYGTGVDHFNNIKTLPTKTIYEEGENFSLDGLVIDAYHSVNMFSNKGNGKTVRTDYVWTVGDMEDKYITVQDSDGKTYPITDFNKLKGGQTYTIRIGSGKTVEFKLKTTDDYKKTVYNTEDFAFTVYIKNADSSVKTVDVENAKITDFRVKADKGIVIGDKTYTMNYSADLCGASGMEADIRKDDVVSGTLYIDTINYYIIRGDLQLKEYGGEKGDANGDGNLDMADVVLVMQSLANPSRYGISGDDMNHITKRGLALADMNGGGITSQDAKLMQDKLLGLA
jgi:hypothetical protein